MPRRPWRIDHIMLPTHPDRWHEALHLALERRTQEGWRLVAVLRGHGGEVARRSNGVRTGPVIFTLIFQRSEGHGESV